MKLFVPLILAVLILLVVAIYFLRPQRKETWFSRDLQYSKASSVLWDRYLAKGVKGVMKEDRDIRNTYKYPGTGPYTGLMCREPNNIRCTGYNTLSL